MQIIGSFRCRSRKTNVHREDLFSLKTWINRFDGDKTTDQKTGANEQNGCDGKFRNHKEAMSAFDGETSGSPSAGRLKRLDRIYHSPRRYQSEKSGGDERESETERQDSTI